MYSGLSVTVATARSFGQASFRQLVDAAHHARQHRRDTLPCLGECVGMALRTTAPHAGDIFDEAFALS